MKILVKLPDYEILENVAQALNLSLDYLVDQELSERPDFTDFMIEQLADHLMNIVDKEPTEIVFTANHYDLICTARHTLEQYVDVYPENSIHLEVLNNFLNLEQIKDTF